MSLAGPGSLSLITNSCSEACKQKKTPKYCTVAQHAANMLRWWPGLVVSALVSINEVTLRRPG